MTETRIDRRFAALKSEGRPALVTFMTAGDPDPDTTLALLKALESAHAIAQAIKVAPTLSNDKTIIVNLSGRGDKDVHTVGKLLGMDI